MRQNLNTAILQKITNEFRKKITNKAISAKNNTNQADLFETAAQAKKISEKT